MAVLAVALTTFVACGGVPPLQKQAIFSSPEPNELVTSPLKVEGTAYKAFYYEGEVDLLIEDANGNEIAGWYGSAKGDWFNQDMTPFTASIVFTPPETAEGALVIYRETEAGVRTELRVPIRFREAE